MLERFFTPYEPSTAVKGYRIAILAPHPDDEVFGCAGAALKWKAQGREVQAFIVTDGVVAGEFSEYPDAEQRRQEKALLRANESNNAATILGLPAPIFLNRQDGALLTDNELEASLLEQLQAWQPTTLVLPSIWEMHRDHRAIAEVGIRLAQQLACVEQITFYEIGVPLLPNCLENITEQFPQKWQAMHCFPSQLQAQHYAEQIKGLNCYRAYTLGLDIHYAEAFCCIAKSELPAFIKVCPAEATTQTLMRAEHAIAHLTSQITALQTGQAAWQSEKEALQNEQATWQSQNNALQLQSNALQSQIEALQSSVSWRITQPLRCLKTCWLKLRSS